MAARPHRTPARKQRAPTGRQGAANARRKPWVNPRILEKPRIRKIRPGPGRYFVLHKDRELAHFDEFSGPEGAKAYLDSLAQELPTGTEVVRRKDGVVLAYLSKSGGSFSE